MVGVNEVPEDPSGRSRKRSEAVPAPTRVRRRCAPEGPVGVNSPLSDERPELSDTMHGIPMQTARPNGVRSSDWLGLIGFLSAPFFDPSKLVLYLVARF